MQFVWSQGWTHNKGGPLLGTKAPSHFQTSHTWSCVWVLWDILLASSLVGFELDTSEIVIVVEWGTFSPLTSRIRTLRAGRREVEWIEMGSDSGLCWNKCGTTQASANECAVSAGVGQTFPVVSSCASLEMQVVGCSRRPDFNKDSLLFSSALKCKLFHRALLLSNTTECKMNTAIRCHTNSLCFLEHHNLLASCGSGSTWSACHLNSLSWKQCELRIGTIVHPALKVL